MQRKGHATLDCSELLFHQGFVDLLLAHVLKLVQPFDHRDCFTADRQIPLLDFEMLLRVVIDDRIVGRIQTDEHEPCSHEMVRRLSDCRNVVRRRAHEILV